MKLTKNDINIERINDVLSLNYETELFAEKNAIYLEEVGGLLALEAERNLIRLRGWYNFRDEYPRSNILAFCNEMNDEYIMLKITYHPAKGKDSACLMFHYDMPYASEIDLAQMIKAVAKFGDIARGIVNIFNTRYPGE